MWFDGQAETFDESSGLEPAVGRRVAQAIVELSGAADDALILDIGAGTGTIGRHFAGLPQRYLALERSRGMLAMFRRALGSPPPNMLLTEADCDRAWPVDAQTATVVFASRVVHHLNAAHFLQETERVCRPGGCLLLGRVTRDKESLPSRLQRYKRSLLAEHGMSIGGGEQAVRKVLDDCLARGATALPATIVASWTRRVTPRQIVSGWEEKPQLTSNAGARSMTAEQRAEIVDALKNWARAELGDLDQAHELNEDYALQGATWNRIS